MNTKSANVIILFLLMLWFTSFSQEIGNGESHVMSLEECVNYALENNQDIQSATFEQYIANARVGETRASGLPQISANGNITNNYELRQTFVDASVFDPSAPAGVEIPIPFGLDYAGDFNISAEQMIFDGSFFVGLRAARTYKELSEKNKIKTEIDVVENVMKAYHTVLISSEQLALLQDNTRRIDTLLQETNVLYENGFAEKLDVNRMKVQRNNLDVQIKKVERALQYSKNLLKFQMGLPVGDTIKLNQEISDFAVDFKIEDVIVEAYETKYENRVEYGQLETNRNLVQLDMQYTRSQYLPTFHAFGTLGYNMGTNQGSDVFNFGDRWLRNGTLGVRMSLPVFDGLRKSYKIQQNKIQLQQIETLFNKLENSLEFEARTSIGALRGDLETLEIQSQNLELAKQVFSDAKIKYKEGVGSNLEILDAESSFNEAETNYYSALYDVLIAKIEVDKAIGKLKPIEN